MKPFMLIFAFLSVCFFAQASSNDSIVKVLSVDTASYLLKNNIVEEEQSTIDTSTEDTFRSEDYAFDGWYNARSTFVSCLTILASFVSIFGIGSIWWSIKRKKISRNCQKRIIIDLIRHFIVNAAIVDGVKFKLREHNMRPEEGVFARLATLESDMNLERFEINSKNYEKIHNLSLSMRNYNLYVNMVEEHFKQSGKEYSKDELLHELQTINKRLGSIVSKLWNLQKNTMKHNISFDDIYNYITNKYRNDVDCVMSEQIETLTDIQNPFVKVFANDEMIPGVNFEEFYKKYVFHKISDLSFYPINLS